MTLLEKFADYKANTDKIKGGIGVVWVGLDGEGGTLHDYDTGTEIICDCGDSVSADLQVGDTYSTPPSGTTQSTSGRR